MPTEQTKTEGLAAVASSALLACGWTQESDGGAWATGCGHLFEVNDGTPKENGMGFCCFCGRTLSESLYTDDEQDEQAKRERSAMSECENLDGQCAASWCDCDYQRRKRESSFAAPHCCAAPCVTRIGDSNGKAFVVYLRDGTKITVCRDKTTKGPAWLEVQPQSKIVAQHNNRIS